MRVCFVCFVFLSDEFVLLLIIHLLNMPASVGVFLVFLNSSKLGLVSNTQIIMYYVYVMHV